MRQDYRDEPISTSFAGFDLRQQPRELCPGFVNIDNNHALLPFDSGKNDDNCHQVVTSVNRLSVIRDVRSHGDDEMGAPARGMPHVPAANRSVEAGVGQANTTSAAPQSLHVHPHPVPPLHPLGGHDAAGEHDVAGAQADAVGGELVGQPRSARLKG